METDLLHNSVGNRRTLILLVEWKGARRMRRHIRVGAALLGLAFVLTGEEPGLRADAKSSVEEIRKELMQLPYSGVFDFLVFSYDKGTVTLLGYAYHSNLKHDAARAAKRASGVDQVIDKIEELPVSPNDDELRWKTYYAIYRDPFLSRYAPGGGLLWGHRHPFGAGFHDMSPTRFPGMEPIGDYPIHIIVKNGKITLLGVVDTEGDKTLAGIRARDVPGSFGVDNELAVEKSEQKSTKQ
jgi:BON domain-containing protein